ncbi:putative parB-like partition protein [Escherichia coli P0299438.7]|nr:putative parB-like partition protein [Escherichia coli P0299438.7]
MLAERGILRLTGLSVKVFRRSWRRASMTENGHVGICTLPNRLPDFGNGAGRQNACTNR